MCLPVHDFPIPPTDEGQTGYEKQLCPQCKIQIWVSEKKRKLLKERKELKLLCAFCCAKKAEGHPVEQVSI
jgi:hypothetical protein